MKLLLMALLLAAPDLHAPYDGLLQRYVDEQGRVAYRDLAANDLPTLDAYLAALAATDPATLDPPAQVAFWLNAYNAAALRGVLAGYDAEGFFARRRFFKSYEFPIAGRPRTLEEIEHEILRRRFQDARIHFALVCASTSCPKLRRAAYRGERLGEQLDDQARGFILDPTRNRFAGSAAELSMIFKWFAEDFAAEAGSVENYLARWPWGPRGIETTSYLEYDWTLNAQPGQRPR